MIEFNVPGMTCGHCTRAVTEALMEVDPQAKVEVDLASKRVTVESARERAALEAALAEAGYAPA